MESHCFVAAEDVNISNEMRELLNVALRTTEVVKSSAPWIDVSSLWAQLQVWREVFYRTICSAMCF